jgi:hypothetical protein
MTARGVQFPRQSRFNREIFTGPFAAEPPGPPRVMMLLLPAPFDRAKTVMTATRHATGSHNSRTIWWFQSLNPLDT